MIGKAKFISNINEIEKQETLGIKEPIKLKSTTIYFNKEDIEHAYIDVSDELNILINGSYFVVEKSNELIQFLNIKFR